jgi:catechol 2,3-dioxygenase-like lactoylglutathione lyase family enzyme
MAMVNHVGLCVTDLDRSRTFYEQVLGFTHRSDLDVPDGPAGTLLQVAEPVGLRAVYLERDGWVLELIHFAREGNSPRRTRHFTEPGLTHVSFTVEDLAASCALVREHGGEVLEDTDVHGLAIMIRDPDGQLLELLPKGPSSPTPP